MRYSTISSSSANIFIFVMFHIKREIVLDKDHTFAFNTKIHSTLTFYSMARIYSFARTSFQIFFLPHYYWDDIQKIHSSRTEQCFYFSFNFFCVVRDHFVVLNQWIDVFLCPFSVFYYVSILILLLLHHIYIASFRSILWIVKFIWFFGINFIPIVCVCAVCSHSMCVCAMLYVWYHFAQQKIHRSCKS